MGADVYNLGACTASGDDWIGSLIHRRDERNKTEPVAYIRGVGEESKAKGAISKMGLSESRVYIELEVHFQD